jgi:hypothetical protein
MSDGGDEVVKEKFTLLPEFFVDLICRITPGIIFLPIWVVILVIKTDFCCVTNNLAILDKFYALIFLIFCAIAYIIGFIADILADLLEPLFEACSGVGFKCTKDLIKKIDTIQMEKSFGYLPQMNVEFSS